MLKPVLLLLPFLILGCRSNSADAPVRRDTEPSRDTLEVSQLAREDASQSREDATSLPVLPAMPFEPIKLGSELWRIFAMGPRHDVLAVVTSDALLLIDWPARTERWRRPLPGEPTHLAFASDGRSIAVLTRLDGDSHISIFELSGATSAPEKLELPSGDGRHPTNPTQLTAAICNSPPCGFWVKNPHGVIGLGTKADAPKPTSVPWLRNQAPRAAEKQADGGVSRTGTVLTRPDGITVDLGCQDDLVIDSSFDRGALLCARPNAPIELRLLELSSAKVLARHLLETRPLAFAITAPDTLFVLTSPPSELGVLTTNTASHWEPQGGGGLVHDISPDKTLAIISGPSTELVEFSATTSETLCHHDVLGPSIAAGFEDDTTLWLLTETGPKRELSVARVLIQRDPQWPATRTRCTRETAFPLALSGTSNLMPRWVREARAFLLPALTPTEPALVLVPVGPNPETLRLASELPTSLYVSPEGDLFGWKARDAEVRLASSPSKSHLAFPNLVSLALCGPRILVHDHESWIVNSIHGSRRFAFRAPPPTALACQDDLLFVQSGGTLHALKLTDTKASPIASWSLPEGFQLPESKATRDGLLFSGGPTGLLHLPLPRSEASKAP